MANIKNAIQGEPRQMPLWLLELTPAEIEDYVTEHQKDPHRLITDLAKGLSLCAKRLNIED